MMAKEERRIALEKTKREFQQQEDVLTLQVGLFKNKTQPLTVF